MSEPSRVLRRWLAAAIAVAALALLVGVVARASSAAFGDEAMALLRYHSNFRIEGALTWELEGERTVGALSPLQFTLLEATQIFVRDPLLALAVVGIGSGLVALAFCVMLARGAVRSARDATIGFDGLVALVVGLGASALAVQMTSGLEATLAMAMTGVFTWLWSQSERVDVAVGGSVLGAFGAALFATRADLGLYGVGVPLVVAVFARDAQRRQAFVAFGVALAGVAALSLWLQLAHGLPVPLAFALEHGARGPLDAWIELARWLGVTAPLWGLVVLELALRRGAPRIEPRVWDLAFGVVTLVFVLDATLGAPAIDVSSLRFLLAAVPPLVFLAARAAVGLRRWAEWRGKRVPNTALLLLAVAAVVGSLPALWSHVALAREAAVAGRIGRFDGALSPARWPGLPELAPIAPPPNDLERGRLKVACAPAGEVGAALPLAIVIDLSGAHDARIARRGFDARELLAERMPDWIWLPSAEGTEWSRALRAEPEFASDYDVFAVGAFEIAVRRTSAYRTELAPIVEALRAR
ncbi:MAG: hypothetical protein K8S98_17800 [Planctomycetes bacterium]|nr:hypothetical protein [Planctomycetota bacterium]